MLSNVGPSSGDVGAVEFGTRPESGDGELGVEAAEEWGESGEAGEKDP